MRTSFRSIAPPATTREPDWLAAAGGIGDRLAREAIWYRAQCNWMGVDIDAAHGISGYRPGHRALGPALGDGTAGIAVFFAQLHAAGESAAFRRTALGAIDHALAHAGQARARGLFTGRLGIAYAAARCGLLLGEERLCQRAARLARKRAPRELETDDFDLVSGSAGAVLGLLALARLLDGDERMVRRATTFGDDLAAHAFRRPGGSSWRPRGERSGHGLCGLAHGAAGAALALLELFAVTGDRRHREAAEEALDYERQWFDPQAGNWPDLRGIERRERRGAFRPTYACTWSHGAPGIALSRLRAWQILGDDRCRAEAAVALATTAAGVERALIEPGAGYTLAHGLAGNADVLLLGGELVPDAGGAPLARRVGEVGIGRYATSIDGWPCGVPGARHPGLLEGHAGIGLFYLRLHDRAVPSPLLAANT